MRADGILWYCVVRRTAESSKTIASTCESSGPLFLIAFDKTHLR